MNRRSTIRLGILVFSLVLTAGGAIAPAATPSPSMVGTATRPTHTSQALPAALGPVLYQAFAQDAGATYAINKNGCAALPKQTLKACFDGSGAHFAGAGSPLALRLTSWGRGNDLASVSTVRPTINGNEASYSHGDLTEWWRVLPIGFEQGFTIAKRPSGNGELTLTLAASRQDAGVPGNGSLTWGKLRYGQLVVTDAKGKIVSATLQTKGDRVLIAVNDEYASYPLTVDPLLWLEHEVTANDGTANNNFGVSVAVSGTTAVIGAPTATVDGNRHQGAAYVFSESNGSWTQTAMLTANDGTKNDEFGVSVTLSGTTAFIGADSTVDGNKDQGAVYVFNESNGNWTQTQKLIASDGVEYGFFGSAVAVSDTTALIGAWCDGYLPDVGCNPGAAYIFNESNGTWAQVQKLTASDGQVSDSFGAAVALDGTTALIGADGFNDFQGEAYVFGESGGAWTQKAELAASDAAEGDDFGGAVALSATTALIGAECAPIALFCGTGEAYVFGESNESWTQTQKLVASDGAQSDEFGYSVALDGATALVGAIYAAINGNAEQGAAYVFTRSGGIWTQTQKLTASDGTAFRVFGSAAALDGTTALVGADSSIVVRDGQDVAYFYSQSDLDLNLNAPQTIGQGQDYVSQTVATNNASAASPAVTATVSVPAAASFISATATQGSCSEASRVVTCDFGPIPGNAGTATANVSLLIG